MRSIALAPLWLFLHANATSTPALHLVQPTSHGGVCLDVVDGAQRASAAVQLWDCHGGSNQEWVYRDHALMAFGGGWCLDVTGGVDEDGTAVQVWPCAVPNRNQSWQRDGAMWRWLGTNRCLDFREGGARNQTRLHIYKCDASDANQQFAWVSETTGLEEFGVSSRIPPASVQGANADAVKAGQFAGFDHISLADFLGKHSVLEPLQQELIDAATSVTPPLPPILLAAIAMEESSGDPSVAGGLMQFTYAPTWDAFGEGDINNARDSLFAGARYLHALLKEQGEDLRKALVAYNGGANPKYVEQIQQWLRGGFPYGAGT